MQTVKTLTDISIAMVVPHEDAIRTILFIVLIPQALLSQNLAMPITWYLSNMDGKQLTPIVVSSVYILAILIFLNILLTFIMTIACTAGNRRLSFMLWYLVMILVFLELFFIAFFASYEKPFIKNELLESMKKRILDSSPESMRILDNIQIQLKCCGASGPDDYTNAKKAIPESCCDPRENPDKLVLVKCPHYGVWYSTRGCAENEAEYLAPYPKLIVSTLWKLALCHIFLLIAAFWYRVMTKMDTMDRLRNKSLMEEFPPLPKPNAFPNEPSPMTYYKTEYNKDHYMELMIKGKSKGRWVPHYRFDYMRNAYQRLTRLKQRLNIP